MPSEADVAPESSKDGVLRRLGPADRSGLGRLLSASPPTYCLVEQELAHGLLDPAAANEAWGWLREGRLMSALLVGQTVMPIMTGPVARAAMATRLRGRRSAGSVVVGPSSEVIDLCDRLAPAWRPRRAFPEQPLLVLDGPPRVEPDRRVHPLGRGDLDLVYPAAVAMFTEELGIAPVRDASDRSFRHRVRALLADRRVYGIVEGGRVIFKAEAGVVGQSACQIQGVWVDPGHRGQNLAAPALAATILACQRDHAPVVSLYANAHNAPALRLYARVGFSRIGTFATMIF